MSAKKTKKTPKGDYEIGYAKPSKAHQFQPGQSGNPAGRPRGRPSFDELLLEEAARIVKYKVGEKVMHTDKDRAIARRAFDLALQGNMRAITYVTDRLRLAQAAKAAKADPQTPLTEEEIAVFKMLPDVKGS